MSLHPDIVYTVEGIFITWHLDMLENWGTMSQKAVLHSSLFQQFDISRICTRSSLFYLPNSCRCNWHSRSEAELSEQQESNCCLQSCELERKNIWLWDQAGRERNRNLPLHFLRATLPASRSLNFKSPSKLSCNQYFHTAIPNFLPNVIKLAGYLLPTFPVTEAIYLLRWEDSKDKGECGSWQQLNCTCVCAAIVFFAPSLLQLWKQSTRFPALSL